MKFLALLLLLLPLSVSAHAFGFSHEAEVNGYQVDIGYSTAAPTPDESVIFDFNLPTAHADVKYTNVWVRITSEEGSVVLASGIHNSTFGGPRLSYVFPDVGTYTVHARYENDSTVLLETSFPVTVVPASSSTIPTSHVLTLLFGLVVGAGAVVGIQKFKSR